MFFKRFLSDNPIYNRINKGDFARNAFILMVGTALAQGVTIFISPILTRIYTPQEFGVFALYTSLVNFISLNVTGKYDLAIILPEKDEDAINVFALSVITAFLLSGLIAIPLIVFNLKITEVFNNPLISIWLYLLPISILFAAIYQCLYYWANRRKQYKTMVNSRFIQATGVATANISLGLCKTGSGGLIVGQIIGQMISIWVLGRQILREDKSRLKFIKRDRIKQQAIRYKKFPLITIFSHSLYSATQEMPVILMTFLFNSNTVGLFALIQKALGVPAVIISRAFGDVFRQKASKDYVLNGNCREIYLKTIKYLILISFIPFIILFIIAPQLFSFLFGKNWIEAGQYARIMTGMLFLQFVASPLSYVFLIAEKQQYEFLWQLVSLLAVIFSFYISHLWFNNPVVGILLYSTSISLLYIVNMFVTYRLACGDSKPKVRGLNEN